MRAGSGSSRVIDVAVQSLYRDQWTRTFGPPAGARELVLLMPPSTPIWRGFARARAELRRGRAVRLVGMGVTVERNWPAWVTSPAAPLALTELDAYLPRERTPLLQEKAAGLEDWLDRVFDGVTPGMRPARVFWSSATDRLLNAVWESLLVAEVVKRLHHDDEIECLDPRWPGARVLGGGQRRYTGGLRRLVGAATTQLMLAASVAKRLKEFATEAPVRRLLRERRAEEQPAPELWFGILGHWPLANRSIEPVIAHVLRSSERRLGVLLLSALTPGRVEGAFGKTVVRGSLLPAIGEAGLPPSLTVDHGISAESWGELLRIIGETVPLALRCGHRAFSTPIRCGVEIDAGSLRTTQLAKLLTLDVLRAREAWHASERLLDRQRFSDATVIMPHATAIGDVVVDQRAQAGGGVSVEVVHGLCDPPLQIGSSRSFTTVKATWSAWEAEYLSRANVGQRLVGGHIPRPVTRAEPRPRLDRNRRVRLLVASSYLPKAWGYDPRLFEHYQLPLLTAVREAALPARSFELRWRPHPGDDRLRIRQVLLSAPDFCLSADPLHADLAWCDVLITSVSSITLEALDHGIPVFVHDVPRWDELALALYHPSRRFRDGAELARALAACLEQLERDPASALEPERWMRRRLFGDAGRPLLVEELLSALRATDAGQKVG